MAFTLSSNSLKLYEDCQKCFYEKVIEKVEHPQGPFPSLPSGMDLLLKDHYDSYRKNGGTPEEVSRLGAKLYVGKNLGKWRSNRTGMRWTDSKGNTLMGAIDDLLVFPNGKHAIFDHKTRGFDLKADTVDKYRRQLEIYTFLGGEEELDMLNDAYLCFWIPRAVRSGGLVRFERKVVKMIVNPKRVPDLFAKAITVLENPKPRASKDCAFCSYRSA